MPVGTDGSSFDFPSNPSECSLYGYTFAYKCGVDGNTYETDFLWQTLILQDFEGTQTTVGAPIVGSYRVAVAGEAITGPTGPTGATGATWRGTWTAGEVYNRFDMVYKAFNVAPVGGTRWPTGITTGTWIWVGSNNTTATNSNYPGLVTNWEIVSGGAIGPTGEKGDIGDEAITFDKEGAGNVDNKRLTYVSESSTTPIRIAGCTYASAERYTMQVNTISEDIRSWNVNFSNNATRSIINKRNSSHRNVNYYLLTPTLGSLNWEGFQLDNFEEGDYVTIIMKQPSSGSTFSYQTTFFQQQSVSGSAPYTPILHYAGGITLPIGNTFGDVDVFYLYCIGLDGSGNSEFLVNHQQFHDGV